MGMGFMSDTAGGLGMMPYVSTGGMVVSDDFYDPYETFPFGMEPRPAVEESVQRILLPANFKDQWEWKATNVMFWARRGRGKTMSTVVLARIMQPRFHAKGWKIKANFTITFADISEPKLGSMVNADPSRASKALMVFDEATELWGSRTSMSRFNREGMEYHRQVRKLLSEVACTTQFPTDCDKQLLKQLDLYILCNAHIPKDARWNKWSAARSYIDLYVFDLWGQFWGNGEPSRNWPPPLWLAGKKVVFRNIHTVWDCYNDKQFVVGEHRSEEQQARQIRRGWDIDKLQEQEEREAWEHMTPEEREHDAAVRARFQEAEAHPERMAVAHEVEQVYVPTRPQSMEQWVEQKRQGRFILNTGTVRQVRKWMVQIETLSDLREYLTNHGFAIWRHDNRYYAESIA